MNIVIKASWVCLLGCLFGVQHASSIITVNMTEEQIIRELTLQTNVALDSVNMISADGSRTGNTVLVHAVLSGYASVVGYFVTNGVLKTLTVETNGLALLDLAIYSKNTSCVELIAAARPDWVNRPGALDSPLSMAVTFDRADMANILLAHGANPNEVEMMGSSLLSVACWRTNREMYELLLSHGAEYGPIHAARAVLDKTEVSWLEDWSAPKALNFYDRGVYTASNQFFSAEALRDQASTVSQVLESARSGPLGRVVMMHIHEEFGHDIVWDYVLPIADRGRYIVLIHTTMTNIPWTKIQRVPTIGH